jgi:hypothetical protein
MATSESTVIRPELKSTEILQYLQSIAKKGGRSRLS